jgi:S1-C subfamily serine protease
MRQLAPVAAAVVAAFAGGLVGGAAWEALDDEATAPGARVAAGGVPVSEVYRRAGPGVVEIVVGGEAGGSVEPDGDARSGSGFLWDDDGRVVTNFHVVDGARDVTVRFPDGADARGRVVGRDPSTDVALVRLQRAPDLDPLDHGAARELRIGDPVVAIGSPFGLAGTVTTGIVSGLNRVIRSPDGFSIDGAIQTDAALNRGNSGGPLLDAAGRVVGINTQIESASGGNVGVGYAVPIETVRDVVSQLIETGRVAHAYLGVRVHETSDGLRIADVLPATPAADAGLRVGDVLLRLGDRRLESAADLRSVLDQSEPGDTVEAELRRGGDAEVLELELDSRPLAGS